MDRKQPQQQQQQQQQQNELQNSNAVSSGIIIPALKVGALTGSTGFITGGLIATLKSNSTPGLFALGSGVNCFILGSTYWGIRNSMIQLAQSYPANIPIQTTTPRDRIPISGVAGALTGATAGLILRGRSNILPGFLVWGVLCTGGQYLYTVADEAHTASHKTNQTNQQDAKKGFWNSLFRSQWSPIKRLTQEEYKLMLREKLLSVEAEIALLDEEIEEVRRKSRAGEEEPIKGKEGGKS